MKINAYAEFSATTKKYTFEIYIAITQWRMKFKRDLIKGVHLFWLGPVCCTLWNNKVHDEWMNKFLQDE